MQSETGEYSASPRICCYTVLDLFSGIGGFSLGLERSGGFRTVAFCEIEEFPRKVLRKHWPNVPIFEDVRKLHATDLPEPIDVICGGYPCQPFSEAGKRQGAEDDRHLWPEMLRIIRETGPTWVIAENVVGHVTMGLDKVLHDLEGEGYTARPIIIPACAVDAPHIRNRIWILAHSKGERCRNGNDRQDNRKADRTGNASTNKSRSICRMETRRWTPEPRVPRVGNGFPYRVDRNTALGNAVVPQVVTMIAEAIILNSRLI